MDTFASRHFQKEPIGDDVFGPAFGGREIIYDPKNKDLFLKMLKNYV